jgi:hypothetical protein
MFPVTLTVRISWRLASRPAGSSRPLFAVSGRNAACQNTLSGGLPSRKWLEGGAFLGQETGVGDEVVKASTGNLRRGFSGALQGVVVGQVASDEVDVGSFPFGNLGLGASGIADKGDDGIVWVTGDVF